MRSKIEVSFNYHALVCSHPQRSFPLSGFALQGGSAGIHWVAKAVYADGVHTCVIDSNNFLHCFGDNTFQQCDMPENRSLCIGVAARHYHTIALTNSGALVALGRNDEPQCEPPNDESTARVTLGIGACRHLLEFHA